MVGSTNKQSNLFAVLSLLLACSVSVIQSSPDEDDPHWSPVDETYDFIVVGGGTAGCIVASRLTENPHWKVLVLEPGSMETFNMAIPLNVLQLQQNAAISTKYQTEPSHTHCLAMKNGQCNWPTGKILGGSSVLNDMIYTRGNRQDFDGWRDRGNHGWSYDDVLPYFKKLENNEIPDAELTYAGKGGPITISYPKYRSDVAKAFMKAGLELEMPSTDYNGGHQIGFSYVQTSTQRGIRKSSFKAYIEGLVQGENKQLHHMKNRPNLHIKQFSAVTRLLMDAKHQRVVGVRFETLGKSYTVLVKHEVILSAGAIDSPKILMMSGIGPSDHLHDAGIKQILKSPVGMNLVDQVAVGGLTFFTNATVLDLEKLFSLEHLHSFVHTHDPQLSSPGGIEALAFFDTKNFDHSDGVPDIEIHLEANSILSHPVLKNNYNLDPHLYDVMYRAVEHKKNHAFTLTPIVLQPKSRGWVQLKNADPHTNPKIHSNYYNHPDDIQAAIRGIRLCLALSKTKAFREIDAEFHYVAVPGCKHHPHNSDTYWECYARHFSYPMSRFSGTCCMGANATETVVDANLKVHGLKGLRIVDASIMPQQVSGNSDAATMMIAEKVADHIKIEHCPKYSVHEEAEGQHYHNKDKTEDQREFITKSW